VTDDMPRPFPEWDELITEDHVKRANEYAAERDRPAPEKPKPRAKKGRVAP